MNLRQIQAFQEVMLTGSVTEAARNMGRTQPAISSLIAGLERSVGYNLFDRRRGRLHPVPEAQFLLVETQAILERLGRLRETMQGVGNLETGHLKIACLPVFAENLMPRLIAQFVKNRNDVSISLVSHTSERVYERMASQQFDLGFAEATTDSSLVDSREFTMNCLCAVSASDELANKSVITPRDLDGKAMSSFLPNHFIRRRLREIFDKEGFQMRVRFEMQNAASQFAFIEQGLACAIMSPLSSHNYVKTRPDGDRIVFIPFEPEVVYRIAILTPAHNPISQLTQAFADLLKNEVEGIIQGYPGV
jgi:DNA-binding transcriptional LysR family regulator